MSFQRCKSSFRDDVPWLSKTSCLCVFGVFGIFGISKVFGSNLVRTTLILLTLELDFKSGSAKIRTLNRTFGPVPKSSVRTLVQNRTMTSLKIPHFLQYCKKDSLIVQISTRPNSSLHIGTIITFAAAFSIARQIKDHDVVTRYMFGRCQ